MEGFPGGAFPLRVSNAGLFSPSLSGKDRCMSFFFSFFSVYFLEMRGNPPRLCTAYEERNQGVFCPPASAELNSCRLTDNQSTYCMTGIKAPKHFSHANELRQTRSLVFTRSQRESTQSASLSQKEKKNNNNYHVFFHINFRAKFLRMAFMFKQPVSVSLVLFWL